MKKSDLKRLIKPIVEECIQESLMEKGLLSHVVSEVMQGMQQGPLVESQAPSPRPNKTVQRRELAAQRRKMAELVGKDAYNGVDLFEGTTPATESSPKPGSADLGDPNDAGVDIGALMGGASKIWQAMK